MANIGSKRNLFIFGGLTVFALGWGGGALLGILRPPEPRVDENKAPQVVDADEYAPDTAATPTRKSSSLLEQVFGLDDLEEEKPTRPRPEPSPSPPAPKAEDDGIAVRFQAGESTSAIGKTDPPEQPVTLEERLEEAEVEERADPTDAPLDSPDPTRGDDAPDPGASPKKNFLDENPYK